MEEHFLRRINCLIGRGVQFFQFDVILFGCGTNVRIIFLQNENVHVVLFDFTTYLFVVIYVSLFAWKLSRNIANTWTNYHIMPLIFAYVRILQIANKNRHKFHKIEK